MFSLCHHSHLRDRCLFDFDVRAKVLVNFARFSG